MTISVEVIARSISSQGGKPLTTVQCRYPRFAHAELMTHRVFSRNASSSRAVPVQRLIDDIYRDPAMPMVWGSNKPGMQAGDELEGRALDMAKAMWTDAMRSAVAAAQSLMAVGLHKQHANRLLEPFSHINVLITSTEWSNFFALRCHPDAMPEMRALADGIYDAIEQAAEPVVLDPGQWHLPYITKADWDAAWHVAEANGNATLKYSILDETLNLLRQMSAARCARLSYLTYEMKKPTIEEDLNLFQRLAGSQPMHASPLEHQATPDHFRRFLLRDEAMQDGDFSGCGSNCWQRPDLHGNFTGWIQHRKLLPNECAKVYVR